MLIFDEYGRVKYLVHNDVFGKDQHERLAYLWEAGLLRARPGSDCGCAPRGCRHCIACARSAPGDRSTDRW